MKVYVVSTDMEILSVCANITLARKKVFAAAERIGFEPGTAEIESSEDEWERSFNCCSEDQRTMMALHRDDYPYWVRYTYTLPTGNKLVFFIDAVEMTGDPVLTALAEIKREIDRIPKGSPNLPGEEKE